MKDIKDGTMLIIPFSQYAWIDNLIDILIKVLLLMFQIIIKLIAIDRIS